MSLAHSVTVLDAAPKLLCKRFSRGPDGELVKRDYGNAYVYTVSRFDVRDIGELAELLSMLEREPTCCVVRGELKSEQTGPVRRLNANFEDVPRSWLMIDSDKLPAPAGLDVVTDPEAAARYLIGHLPAEFHEASFAWQLSSSAGLVETVPPAVADASDIIPLRGCFAENLFRQPCPRSRSRHRPRSAGARQNRRPAEEGGRSLPDAWPRPCP